LPTLMYVCMRIVVLMYVRIFLTLSLAPFSTPSTD
jgi:hypothetical protein